MENEEDLKNKTRMYIFESTVILSREQYYSKNTTIGAEHYTVQRHRIDSVLAGGDRHLWKAAWTKCAGALVIAMARIRGDEKDVNHTSVVPVLNLPVLNGLFAAVSFLLFVCWTLCAEL